MARVVSADPGREFAFTVIVKGRESTRWRYRFEPSEQGALVKESYEFGWAPWYFVVADILLQRDRQLRRGMRKTLGRLKAAAEAS